MNESQDVCWLDTAKPARYTEHDERSRAELERALLTDRQRFAGAVSPSEAAEASA
jgi:hypothetical protein